MTFAHKFDSGLPVPQRYFAVIALSLGTALAVIDGAIANVALPTMAHDLSVGSTAAVLVVTVYQLILVMTLLPFSALGDRIGHNQLYGLGQLVFAVASGLAFFADNLPLLLVMRALQAIGAAASLSVSTALIRAIYPANQLGRGLGFNTVVVTSMSAFAPTLGGLILVNSSWQMVFTVGAPLAFVSMLLGYFTLPKTPRLEAPFDYKGALLCALGLGLAVSGLETIVQSNRWLLTGILLVSGVAILAIFIGRDVRSSLPILPLDLMRRPVLALSSCGSFVAFIASMSFIISLPFRLQQDYGFSPAQVGAVMAAWPLVMIFVAPLAGVLSDKIAAGILGGIGMAIAAIGLALFAYLPAAPHPLDLMWRMAICGIGFALFLTPNARLLVGSVPRTRAASVGGFVSMTRLTGQALGATLAAAVLGMRLGNGRVPALISCGLVVIAGILSVARLTPLVRNPTE
jgi:MFS transporter, DHA2 family, multidrug resistance protein